MNKYKILKWALPAILLSAMTFEIMPGSVSHSGDLTADPEMLWNFFSLPVQGMATSCLGLAGVLTLATMVLALVVTIFKKKNLYRLVSYCSLGAAALASVPYMAAGEIKLFPNVVIILILTCSWLLALFLDKQKDDQEEKKLKGRRL